MTLKSADFYGRSLVRDAPAGDLEIASGDVGPPNIKPTMVFVGLLMALVALRLLYESGES